LSFISIGTLWGSPVLNSLFVPKKMYQTEKSLGESLNSWAKYPVLRVLRSLLEYIREEPSAAFLQNRIIDHSFRLSLPLSIMTTHVVLITGHIHVMDKHMWALYSMSKAAMDMGSPVMPRNMTT
jgi:hypothetical protein